MAATLAEFDPGGVELTAVFAYRSRTAFVGVLGALLAGHGYVPLNPSFPIERTRAMFRRSGCRTLIVDAACQAQLSGLLDEAEPGVVVMALDADDVAELRTRWPAHVFLSAAELKSAEAWRAPVTDPNAIAYLLFTSGSTGIPKGVMVAHRNVVAFIDYMVDLYDPRETDRFSQMFDMTFDLSVFDMFVCWERGAMLCCPSQKTLIKPGQFIREMELTIWFSVPSTAIFMKQLGMLKPDRYPSLRLCLFCGEPLPAASVVAWSEAAPNGVIENLYGPTELTIACTRYRWDRERSPADCEMGIVPIGDPYPGMQVLVVDEALNEVQPGETGELLMAGPQMSLGYWNDPDKTAAAFVTPPGRDQVFYRTGDRVRRTAGGRPMTHLGRVDFQVKVMGYRVELGEIEQAIRDATGLDGAVALGWPATPSGYGGVEAFVEGGGEGGVIRDVVSKRLPDYMTPRRIHFLDRIPRNANDKFDRGALTKMLEEGL
ncbi:MAG: amino acid adenylation domain-containing protein [Phenylobacterium sp.]|nr:amino acid adenylation domain-containing protein [Phenylobacterium sp.]